MNLKGFTLVTYGRLPFTEGHKQGMEEWLPPWLGTRKTQFDSVRPDQLGPVSVAVTVTGCDPVKKRSTRTGPPKVAGRGEA